MGSRGRGRRGESAIQRSLPRTPRRGRPRTQEGTCVTSRRLVADLTAPAVGTDVSSSWRSKSTKGAVRPEANALRPHVQLAHVSVQASSAARAMGVFLSLYGSWFSGPLVPTCPQLIFHSVPVYSLDKCSLSVSSAVCSAAGLSALKGTGRAVFNAALLNLTGSVSEHRASVELGTAGAAAARGPRGGTPHERGFRGGTEGAA